MKLRPAICPLASDVPPPKWLKKKQMEQLTLLAPPPALPDGNLFAKEHVFASTKTR